MNICKNIMVIVAHPDDEVCGMGGTIARLCDEGNRVHVLYVTNGETSCGFDRYSLVDSVATILGFHSSSFLDFPDQKLDTIPQSTINNSIRSIIDSVKPDVVYTHAKEELNIDHRLIHDSVMVACRPVGCVKELYTFQISEWDFGEFGSFVPNTFVTVDCDRKINAMLVYDSEIKNYPHPMSLHNIKTRSIDRGAKFCRYELEEFKQVFRVI